MYCVMYGAVNSVQSHTEMCLRKKKSFFGGFVHVMSICVVFCEWHCACLLRSVTLTVALAETQRAVCSQVCQATDRHKHFNGDLSNGKGVSYDVTPPEPRDWLQAKEERFLLVV